MCPHCTDDARYVEHRTRTILTVCGPAELTRAYYHCSSCGTGHSPADDALALDGRYSPGAQPLVALAGVLEPFRRAEQLLEQLAGLRVSKEACRVFTEQTGERQGEGQQPQQDELQAAGIALAIIRGGMSRRGHDSGHPLLPHCSLAQNTPE